MDLWQPYLSGGLAEVLRILAEELGNSRELALGLFSLFVYQLILYCLAIAGLLTWRARSKESNLELLIALGIILILMLTPMILGDARFRVPAQPFLLVFAGFGMARIFTRAKNKIEPVEIPHADDV
jgi:CHASE2 domain-containing sensor protein